MRKRTLSRLEVTLLLLALPGCGDTSNVVSGSDGPVYATMTNVYQDEDRTVYVALTDTLDLDELTFDEAYELPGVGNLEAIGGKLLLSSGETPLITKFDVAPPSTWTEQGSLSFTNFPLEDNANFFYQYLVDEHAMYLPFEGYKRIVWDPTDLAILDVMEDSALEPELDGLTLTAGGNRSGIRYDGPVMQPFFYKDEDWFEFAPVSQIAVYDPVTHEETKIIEAPCPGLAIPSQDEAGNTYFSTWDYSPIHALYGQGPAPCVARVTPDHELDEDFTTDFTEWTDGRFAVNFRYVRDGWGLADVVYPETFENADFDGPIDEVVLDEFWNPEHWKIWRIDIERGRAEPFEGIDVEGAGWSAVEVDGRSFLFVPYEDWGRTRVYELDESGEVSTHLDLLGDAFWMRVR
jgi:hypothetical protein